MKNRLFVCLMSGCLAGQAGAQQQTPWTPSPASYVPLWVMSAPMQPVPQPYLLPQRVPFPLPFWMWYAPAPGMPWALPVPPAGVQTGAVPPARGETPAAGATTPDVHAPAVTGPTLEKPAPTPADQGAAVEAVAPAVKPEPAKVEPAKTEASPPVQPPAKAADQSPAKPVATPRAPARKTVSAPAKTSAPVKPVVQTPPAPAKTGGKTRKLCWKDGRLDVCE